MVCNLENSPLSTRQNIIQMAILEDPVYMRWVLMNLIEFDYIFTIGQDDFERVVDTIPNNTKVMALAFYLSPLEDRFLEELIPEKYKQRYGEEVDYLSDFTLEQHQMARRQILHKMRQLQRSTVIREFEWQMPSGDIASGLHIKIPAKGPFELFYEDGKLALSGQFENKLREGMWQHYYSNGQMIAEGIYISEEKEGDWTFYKEDGSLMAQGAYHQDSRTGDWTIYDANGESKVLNFDRFGT